MARIDHLSQQIRPLYNSEDPAHDWAHVQRVLANCRFLQAREGGDLEILLAAALLHDIVNLPKNHPQRRQASAMSARAAREYLKADFALDEIEKICTAIEEHSFSLGKSPSTLEAALLQDADRLDAVGAIGVMRTVATGSKMGSAFYFSDGPFSKDRTLEDNNMVDHFYIKTLKLAEGMNTKTARKVAEERVAYMRGFLGQLQAELDGEK